VNVSVTHFKTMVGWVLILIELVGFGAAIKRAPAQAVKCVWNCADSLKIVKFPQF